MNLTIAPRTSVACVAMGLIASGYDLYDRQDQEVEALCRRVRDVFADDRDLLAYFSRARTGGNAVNPYWPRGSNALIAAWFMENHTLRCDWGAYAASQDRANSTAPAQRRETMRWLEDLPGWVAQVLPRAQQHGLLAELAALEQARCAGWQDALLTCRQFLARQADVPLATQQIVFCPSLLMAPQLTDMAHDGNYLVVIAASPRMASLVHEVFHDVVHARLARLPREALQRLTDSADRQKLSALGYAWGTDEDSSLRMAEESCVRVLCCLTMSRDGTQATGCLDALRAEGFAVPEHLLTRRISHPLRLSEALGILGLHFNDWRTGYGT